MATCANCIHHSLCDYNTNVSGNGKIRLVYAEGADVKCSFFQNTADVVQKSEVEKIFEKLKVRECSNSVCTWCVHSTAYGRRNEECDKPYIDKNGKEQKACYVYAKFESLIDNELAKLKKKYTEDA